jgi:hypothetical protein
MHGYILHTGGEEEGFRYLDLEVLETGHLLQSGGQVQGGHNQGGVQGLQNEIMTYCIINDQKTKYRNYTRTNSPLTRTVNATAIGLTSPPPPA